MWVFFFGFVLLLLLFIFFTRTQFHSRPPVAFQILLSLFVAVILDNLELDEDLKKLKQVRGGSRFLIAIKPNIFFFSLRSYYTGVFAQTLYKVNESRIHIISNSQVPIFAEENLPDYNSRC